VAQPLEIVNRVASSGLITLDLEEYYDPRPRHSLDIAPWLWQGLVLREQEFRDAIAAHAWEMYRGGVVAAFCSAEDAIVQTWAWMLIGTRLAAVEATLVVGTPEELERTLFRQALAKLDIESLRGARVVLKGCSALPVPGSAYGELAARLAPVVQSLMFGEACSAVPVYKQKKASALPTIP
jgi:hypothetical protein